MSLALAKAALRIGIIATTIATSFCYAEPAPKTKPTPIAQWKSDSVAEARLAKVYGAVASGKNKEALELAQALTRDYPHFHLAHLALGDILLSHSRTLVQLGDVGHAAESNISPEGDARLTELRQEMSQRVKTLKVRPDSSSIPSQFLELPTKYQHAIAIDTSQSRLFLFQNSPTGMQLVGDYYTSVGKLGVEKIVEGDQRTPLGVYFITSRLDSKKLPDFYGSGALPINYPNPLDQSRGKTGSGIWLHGAPPDQFSRAPLSSDGCVVLSNPDIEHILRTVSPRTTPIVIAKQLQWVPPNTLQNDRKSFQSILDAWSAAKSAGDIKQLLQFYAPNFQGDKNKSLQEWTPVLEQEASLLKGRLLDLKDTAFLRWVDSAETMVVTFGEVPRGARTGPIKRQYWMRKGQQWQIIFEGVIG